MSGTMKEFIEIENGLKAGHQKTPESVPLSNLSNQKPN